MKTKYLSNNIKMKWFTKHKNKIVQEKVLAVKSIHNSKDSLKKVWKLQIKFSEFDYLTGYSVFLMLFETNFIFMLFDTNFVFMLFALMLIGT